MVNSSKCIGSIPQWVGPHPQHGYMCSHWPIPFLRHTPDPPTLTQSLDSEWQKLLHYITGQRSTPLPSLLRSLILHKHYGRAINHTSLAWAQLHTDYRCNTFIQMILHNTNNSFASATKTINQCYFPPSAVEVMWETLSWVNHILSMRPTSSICSLNLQGFALIIHRENYRVEEDRDKHYQMAKSGFPGCASYINVCTLP